MRTSKFSIIKKVALSMLFMVFLTPYLHGASSRPVFYKNTKTLGMGGACIAVVDDEQSLFSNPAGLGKRTSSAYSLLNGTANRNIDYDSVNSSIESLNSAETNASRMANNKNILDSMGKFGYQHFSNLAYYLGSTGFGIGMYYGETEELSIKNPTNPILTSRIDKDTMLTGSIARSFNERQNLFQDRAIGWWGSTLKIVSRKSGDHSFFSRDFGALNEEKVKEANNTGVAFDFDLGAVWQLSNPWQASFGVFAGNILESEFSAEAGYMRRQFGLGFAIKPLTGPPERNDKLTLAADYFDSQEGGSALTKIRLGMDAKLSKYVSLQTGFNGGYPTAGISINWGDARVQAATYGEELGDRPGDKEDRRYSISAAFEF